MVDSASVLHYHAVVMEQEGKNFNEIFELCDRRVPLQLITGTLCECVSAGTGLVALVALASIFALAKSIISAECQRNSAFGSMLLCV